MHIIHTRPEGLYSNTYDHILQLLQHTPVPRIGISGGSTPLPLYDLIERKNDPFFQTSSFFMVDERYVAHTKPRSNIGAVVTHMPSMSIYGWDTSLHKDTIHEDYHHLLGDTPLDLCILGVGKDGHIASLFPQSKALESTEQLITTKAPDGEDRLSMSLPYIMSSRHLLLLFCGPEKRWIENELRVPSKHLKEAPFLVLKDHKSLSVVNCELQ